MNIDQVLKAHGIGTSGSFIKSIQRGFSGLNNATGNTDISISEVDTSKSIVIARDTGGNASAGSYYPVSMIAYATLINPTTLRIQGNASSQAVAFAWQVVEFSNIKRIQRGTILVTGNTITSVNIANVDMNKAILFYSFSNNTTSNQGYALAGELNDVNKIKFFTTQGSMTISWQVVEFN